MMIARLTALFLLISTVASAQPVTEPLFSLSFGTGPVDRSGNAMNGIGFPNESERFNVLEFGALAAVPVGPFHLQGAVTYRGTDIGDLVNGVPANDSSTDGSQYALQLGHMATNAYFGAGVAYALTNFGPADADQNAETLAYGVVGAYHLPRWSFTGQVGLFESSAEDAEVLDEGRYLSLAATRFVNDGRTGLGARMSVADGDQDIDGGVLADPVDLFELGLRIDHALADPILGGTAILFASVDWLQAAEGSNLGIDETANEVSVSLGFEIVFGAGSVQERGRRTAPGMVNVERWQALVPVVD